MGRNVVATQGLTVQGTFTANGGIPGMYSSSHTDSLLTAKQDILSDQAGTGVTLKSGNSLRRIFGQGGCVVSIPLNLANTNDPQNFQIKVDTSSLQNSLTLLQDAADVLAVGKQDTLTSSSSVAVGTLNVASAAEVSLIRAPASSSLTLVNNSGTVGLTVNASNGHVGIQKASPTVPLDVYGSAAIRGSLTGGGAGTFAGPIQVSGGDFYAGRAAIECVDDGTMGSLLYLGSNNIKYWAIVQSHASSTFALYRIIGGDLLSYSVNLNGYVTFTPGRMPLRMQSSRTTCRICRTPIV